MDKDAVRLFAGYVGTKVESISSQGWAQMKCPLARWTHDTGRDSNPSAAIKINPQGESFFTCFTCEHHDLLDLVLRLRELGAQPPKVNIKAAMELVNAEADQAMQLSIKDYDAPIGYEDDDGNNDTIFEESWLETFMQARKVPMAMAYLKGRGLDPYTVNDLDIRWDVTRRTVCFPLRDQYGRLCGLRGRRIAPGPDQPSYHMYKTKPGDDGRYNRMVWIGENHLDFDKPVLMVESVFDYAACYALYENVCGPLTVGFNQRKAKRMAAAVEIVTLFDLGAGGNKARERIDTYLPGNQRTHLYPCGPDRLDPEEKAKDPGEMRRDVLLELLSAHLPVDSP